MQGVSPVAPFLLLGVLASQDTHLSAHPHPTPPPARGHQLVVVSQGDHKCGVWFLKIKHLKIKVIYIKIWISSFLWKIESPSEA